MTTQMIEREALKLPMTRRVRLAEKLMASVDDPTMEAASAEWTEEIAARLREIESGTDPGVPAEQVHAEARRRLPEARRLSPARHR